jgi:hypothetical protein
MFCKVQNAFVAKWLSTALSQMSLYIYIYLTYIHTYIYICSVWDPGIICLVHNHALCFTRLGARQHLPIRSSSESSDYGS